MKYTVFLSPRALRDRRCLPPNVHQRVTAALLALENNPRSPGYRKMARSDEWRIRVFVILSTTSPMRCR
jgi:mRNA-degrading endonuclease RelE of RelBE toxin-antitoxin system